MNHRKEKIPCPAQNQTGSNIALLAELFVGTASVKAGLNGDIAEMWREGGSEGGGTAARHAALLYVNTESHCVLWSTLLCITFRFLCGFIWNI